MAQQSSGIGGQALIEGIMMRNREKYALAVRKPDREIELEVRDYKSVLPWPWVPKVPILRGISSFLDSLIIGTSCTMWSAQFFDDEESADKSKAGGKADDTEAGEAGAADAEKNGPAGAAGKEEKSEEQKKKEDRAMKGLMAGTVLFSLVLAVGLFILLPYFLASVLRRFGAPEIAVLLTEALLRIAIFLGYMFLISRMKDIQRVFAYHGAEHKCINCIEHGLPLTVENVMKSSRQHKRCGTSFLLIVITISVICFLLLGLLGLTNPLQRILLRLLLIPVIAGVAFEFLRLAGKYDNPVINLLVAPGLALQRLVTREPDEEIAEVAIASVEAVFDWKAWEEEHFPADKD